MGIAANYIEKCYAGWLAKLAGIRLGGPIEGWTYHKIQKELGEIDGYVCDISKFAADDDSNGPMLFIRALNDYICSPELTAEQVGETWLNYAPYEHGLFWWGGYGKSTEHTAYLNLRAGIPAPRSGSIEQNGAAVAEQIGGQIFIDSWGLVCPGNPQLAATLAEKAASVSHDGNGVYGGVYIAAAIAMAFSARSIREIVDGALKYIPGDCEYARTVRAVTRFVDEHPGASWRDGYQYIYENFGYDRYPGNCHIIPNAAVMILALLTGGEDFDRTLNICNMCGWDTDCNVGNVATIMGVYLGLDAIDYGKWLAPINDGFAVSGVLGCLNYLDAPWCAAYLADIAYRLCGEPLPEPWTKYLRGGKYFGFELPGSTHSFEAEGAALANAGGCLKIESPGEGVRIFRRIFHVPEDFMDNRYDPAFTPQVWPGQTVTFSIRGAEGMSARAYAHDLLSGRTVEGAQTPLTEGGMELTLSIAPMDSACIDRIGIALEGAGVAHIDEVRISGAPDFGVDCSKLRMEVYTGLHREVNQFTIYKGNWDLLGGELSGSCADEGACYTGDIEWEDYAFEAEIAMATDGACALLFRAGGTIRGYSALIDGTEISLTTDGLRRRELARAPLAVEPGEYVRLLAECRGDELRILANGAELLRARDGQFQRGCVGFACADGARIKVRRYSVRPL